MNMMMLAELQIHLELLHPIKSCSIVDFKCNGLLYREYIVVYMCFGRGIGMAAGWFGLGFAVTMPKPKVLISYPTPNRYPTGMVFSAP